MILVAFFSITRQQNRINDSAEDKTILRKTQERWRGHHVQTRGMVSVPRPSLSKRGERISVGEELTAYGL
jgi:hypothetical protein